MVDSSFSAKATETKTIPDTNEDTFTPKVAFIPIKVKIIKEDELPEKKKDVLKKIKKTARGRVDILAPADNPNEPPKMSSDNLNKLMDQFLEKAPKKDPTLSTGEKKDVKLGVNKMTANGEMGINFN